MPLSHYFGGRGAQVMHRMKLRYGPVEGERVFYATAKKRRQEPQNLASAIRRLPKKKRGR